MPAHLLTAPPPERNGEGSRRALHLEPDGAPLVQRSFVPFSPRKRLYGVNVGTPAGIHFAYDTETGALLRAWRGKFLDTTMMWEGRGNGQLGRPAGPALTFSGLPEVALIELGQEDDWPNQPDALLTFQAYKLRPDGLPIFFSRLADLKIRDEIAPAAAGIGLARSIELNGELSTWSTWVLLAAAKKIVAQPDGEGWIVGDREWYLDWPKNSDAKPVIRDHGDHQELAVSLTRALLGKPINFTVVW
jgi:hypothetical protein